MMNRTIREIYNQGRKILTEAGLESPAFDAMSILSKVFGINNRSQLAIQGDETASEPLSFQYMELIERRLTTPLQYILGQWEFDGMALNVGEGVLIPREDTLTLVEAVQSALDGINQPKILDLCAGTGAVGIALAHRISKSEVICVEKSDQALPYLRQNITEFGDGRVKAIHGDVLQAPKINKKFHCIVSNPPYIPSCDINQLQWEVQCEPHIALDGGSDGLDFYRAICSLWMCLLKPDGIIAFETGYDISDGVTAIMEQYGVHRIHRFRDFGGIDRCIIGHRLRN